MKYFQMSPNLKTGVLLSTAFMLLAFCIGLALEALISTSFQVRSASITFYNFYTQDTLWCLFAAAMVMIGVSLPNIAQVSISDKIKNVLQSESLPWFFALAVGLFMCFGAILIHGYTYSLDEYLVEWQAAISLNGDLVASIPNEFQAYRSAIQSIFVFNFDDNVWTSGYRPVFGWVWAMFELLNIGLLTNAILSAACMPLIHRIAKNIWPDKPWLWGLAVVLLATSPHFIFPAMTSFVWSAVLFFNLLWLCCFIQPEKKYQFIALVIGFLAVGLHQIHAHLIFAAPFVLWAFFSKKYQLFVYSCISYLLAIVVWLHWHEIIEIFLLGSSIDDLGFFLNSAYLRGYFFMREAPLGTYQFSPFMSAGYIVTNVVRFLAWLGLPLLVLFLSSIFMCRKKPVLVNLCLCSILLTFIIHSILMPDGMHGWGYRYMQGAMGSVVILAVFAFDRCVNGVELGAVKFEKLLNYLGFLLVVSVLVSLPLRSTQMNNYIQPKKDALSFLREQNVDVILLDSKRIFFGVDILRNDPYLLNRPIIMAISKLSEDQRKELCQTYKTSIMTYKDLAHFGIMHTVPPAALAAKMNPVKKLDVQKYEEWGCILGET